MPRQEIIRAQVTPEDGALFSTGYGNSIFRVSGGIRTYSDKVRQPLDLGLDDAKTGREIKVNIEKQATLLGEISIKGILPALTIGAGGTYARYQDFAPLALIKSILIKYGSNTLYEDTPEAMFHDYLLCKDDEAKRSFEKIHSGNLTAAERNTRALAPQPFRFKIPLPWNCCDTHDVPISALSNKISITLKLAEAREIIQSDGAKPTTLTLTNLFAEQQFIHMTGNDRAQLTALTLRPDGLDYLYTEHQQYSNDIAIGALTNTGYVVPIEQTFTGPIRNMTMAIRRTADLDPTANDPTYYDLDASLIEGVDFEFKASNLEAFERTDSLENEYHISKYFNSGPESKLAYFFWEELPLGGKHGYADCASGNLSVDSLCNKKVYLYQDVANTEALTATFVARRWNWHNQQAGNLQKIWQ